jgi:hypothetical protein
MFKMDKESDGGAGAGSHLESTATTTTGTTNESSAEVVEKAKALGWVPQEQFKGRGGEWVDAEEFVRRGQEVLPIVKENLRRVQEDLKTAKAEIAAFGKTAEEFRKFTEEAAERKVAEWKAEASALKKQLAQAVTDGEGEVAASLMEQIEEHREADPTRVSESKTASPSTPTVDPKFIEWRRDNPWYENPHLQEVAILKGISLNRKDGLVGEPLYKAVRKAMAEIFPDEVESDGDSGGMFDGGGASGRRSTATGPKAKTFENLPKEARDACERMIKKGFLKDRKQYLENYDWSGE